MGKKAAKKIAKSLQAHEWWGPESEAEEDPTPEPANHNFARHFRSETICILIGSDKVPYHVHTSILEDRCPYFRTRADFADKGQLNHKESINWEEVTSCQVFDQFIEYLYTGEINQLSMSRVELCKLLIQLHTLADYLMMDDLKATAVDHTRELLQVCVGGLRDSELQPADTTELLKLAYEATPHQNLTADFGSQVETLPVEDPDLSPDNTMRTLMARFAATKLDKLKLDNDFIAVIAQNGDIAKDLISFLRPACNL